MVYKTDSKTVLGCFEELGRVKTYEKTVGGETFRGQEVKVRVCGSHPQVFTMYIGADTRLGMMRLSMSNVLNRRWLLSVHGETEDGRWGLIYIDGIQAYVPSAENYDVDYLFEGASPQAPLHPERGCNQKGGNV